MKETIWRAKRLTREMQSYWKRYDRVERETRRRLEKEAEEQRKMDVELIEVINIDIYSIPYLECKKQINFIFFSNNFIFLHNLGKTTTKKIELSYYTN